MAHAPWPDRRELDRRCSADRRHVHVPAAPRQRSRAKLCTAARSRCSTCAMKRASSKAASSARSGRRGARAGVAGSLAAAPCLALVPALGTERAAVQRPELGLRVSSASTSARCSAYSANVCALFGRAMPASSSSGASSGRSSAQSSMNRATRTWSATCQRGSGSSAHKSSGGVNEEAIQQHFADDVAVDLVAPDVVLPASEVERRSGGCERGPRVLAVAVRERPFGGLEQELQHRRGLRETERVEQERRAPRREQDALRGARWRARRRDAARRTSRPVAAGTWRRHARRGPARPPCTAPVHAPGCMRASISRASAKLRHGVNTDHGSNLLAALSNAASSSAVNMRRAQRSCSSSQSAGSDEARASLARADMSSSSPTGGCARNLARSASKAASSNGECGSCARRASTFERVPQ